MTDITYDPEADAVYITVGRGKVDRTEETGPFIYDVDAEGRIVGIEILSASKVLAPETGSKPPGCSADQRRRIAERYLRDPTLISAIRAFWRKSAASARCFCSTRKMPPSMSGLRRCTIEVPGSDWSGDEDLGRVGVSAIPSSRILILRARWTTIAASPTKKPKKGRGNA